MSDQPGVNGSACHPERSEGGHGALRTALPPYRLTALPFTPMTAPQPRAVPIPQVADAEAKQLQLDRMKRRATGLLVVMSAVFLVTLILEPQHPWLGYVRATAEAAMVGGLADWFAITALFRHPLNIPIPHTAIIPNRKDRIGRTLGNFVQHNFLSPEVLGPRLLALQPSRRAAEWLRRPEHARSLSTHAASALRSATDVVRDEDVHGAPRAQRDRAAAPALDRAGAGQGARPAHRRRSPPAAAGPGDPRSRRSDRPKRGVHPGAHSRGEPLVGAGLRGRAGTRQGDRRHPAHPDRGLLRSRTTLSAAVRRAAHRLDRAAAGLSRSDRARRRGEAAALRQPHQPAD